MNERRVEVAEFCLTKGCLFCGSTTGPFVDRDVEDNFGNRLYECASCTRLGARALGLVKGKRQDELAQADKLMREKDEEAREIAARNVQLTDSNALLVAENTRLSDTVALQTQRIAQLSDAHRKVAEGILAEIGA